MSSYVADALYSLFLAFTQMLSFSFGATAPILTLAYLHETFRFTSVYYIL
jgi:hypothetical protein